jgi:hypothetical protein
MILIPLSIENVYSPAGSVPPVSHLTSCIPTKSNLYFDIYFATVMSEPALYRLLTFHMPNLISIFLSLGRLSKESVEVRDPLWHFVTQLCFTMRSCYPTPNSQAGGPSLVGCPRLIIQYIRSCPPYLEAVSSIRNPRTRHAVVTRGPFNMDSVYQCIENIGPFVYNLWKFYQLQELLKVTKTPWWQ